MTFLKSLFAIVSLACVSAANADAPFIDPANDEANFGDIQDELFWTTAQKVAGFRNMNKLTWTREIPASQNPMQLPYKLVDLSSFTFDHENAEITLDDYIRTQNVAGFLVIQKGVIVYERYELGNSEESTWLSWSIAKSVTSMLVGAAIQDGYIASVDEKVSDYLPRLKDSSYDNVTIRNLMQMVSGVEWNEDYADPEADINQIEWDSLSINEQLARKTRVAEPGEVFNYNTAETNLVGTLVRAAVGNNLSTYLGEKIWRPFGMESDAYWNLTEPGGGEHGGSNLNATLRDYGRIGLFALNDGILPDGSQVLPTGWMDESTSASPGAETYGYLWWLGSNGVFAASGIFGQAIRIDPVSEIVIAQQSAREVASQPADWAMQAALFEAIVHSLSDKEVH